MTVLQLKYKSLGDFVRPDSRDRVVVEIQSVDLQPVARWVFKNGHWARVKILELTDAQITVTDSHSNLTWTFSHAEAQQAVTAAQTLHGRVVQR